MKVTVAFGDTSVVVPCKAAWTVRDLVEQATRRYRRVSEQHSESALKTHHLEYTEGGILDMDDLLGDLIEDRDKLVAVMDEAPRGGTDSPRELMSSPRELMSNGYSSSLDPSPSPEPMHYYPHTQSLEPTRGEIEVNEASLKANNPLLVRSSSDSALPPTLEMRATPPPNHHRDRSPEPEISDVLRGALDRLRTDDPPAKMNHVNFSTLTRTVEFPGDWGPLGIHVVPYSSSLSGRTLGLHIKGIEQSSRAKRESLFQEEECIVQINSTPLQDKTFAQSQEVFRQAMTTPSVRLEVVPAHNKPRYEKSLIGQLFTADGRDAPIKAKSPMVTRARTETQPPEPRQDGKINPRPDVGRSDVGRMDVGRTDVGRPDSRTKTLEPARVNTPPAEQLLSRHGSLERSTPSSTPTPPPPRSLSPTNPPAAGRKAAAGKRMKIDLRKGPEGLGFTVVTRDSSVHGPGPILVKNILQRGAAVKDGRLQPGDRILEVNGVDMTGRSQEELVGMLRSTKQGESVSVVVARQDDGFLPRELKGDEAGSVLLEDGREQLMYEVPLNESGSAGLGVSLKGNKSRETGEDLGIFIKSIIHGGAAHKDGRLSVNDQMIAVNGESLVGRSNHTAMETLRRSMSSEGNSRGTIQLVVLRAPRQIGSANPAPNGSASQPASIQSSSVTQEPWGHQGPPLIPSRPPNADLLPPANGTGGQGHYAHDNPGNALYPAAAANGGYAHHANQYSNDDDDDEDGEEETGGQSGFPSPPSPGTVEEMNRDLPLTPPQHREFQQQMPQKTPAFYTDQRYANYKDNVPRNRTSKSMDLVADESNVGSLVGQRNEPSSAGGAALGPTLGLWKSSSLESLQTAMSEAEQNRAQARVPFHRPRPHMVRGRGANQSFRIAIDKSYEGPSEDDDDMTDNSSGHDTAASGSSRNTLDDTTDKKKKKKGKKKEKKSKGKKKTDDHAAEDPDKKTKKKGFGLLRFGKKNKENKDAKGSKTKLDALSEEELDRSQDRDSHDPRYAEVQVSHYPDVEDDDSDPNYARISHFRTPPSPQSLVSRTPSPHRHHPPPPQAQASAEELDGLYAKVNKPRPPQNQPQTHADSRDQALPGLRREQQPRAAPGYEELEAARRRVLDYDPNRIAPRGAESSRPAHRYEEVDRQYPAAQPRRDPYDYPTHSRPVAREPVPYPGVQAPANPRHYPPSSPRPAQKQQQQQHRAAVRQDVPPSPGAGRRGRHYYEAVGGHAHRQASPGRYASPERQPHPTGPPRERYASPDRYPGYPEDRQQPDPRRKNPLINAV